MIIQLAIKLLTLIVCLFVITSCSMNPENCDPTDDSFGNSFRCQAIYEERNQEEREKIMALSEGIEKREATKREIGQKAITMELVKNRLITKTKQVEAELKRQVELRRISQEELDEVRRSLNAVLVEVDLLTSEANEVRERSSSDYSLTIQELEDEERELEALLLSLES